MIENLAYLDGPYPVKFYKSILITTSVEINSKKYASFWIFSCTIFPNFATIEVKLIIKSFVNLIFMWVVKLVESLVSDLGAEVLGEKPCS